MRGAQASKLAEHHKMTMHDMLVSYREIEERLKINLTPNLLEQRRSIFKAIDNVREQIEKLEDPEYYTKIRKRKFDLEAEGSDLYVQRLKVKKPKNQKKIRESNSGIRKTMKTVRLPIMVAAITPGVKAQKKRVIKKKKR